MTAAPHPVAREGGFMRWARGWALRANAGRRHANTVIVDRSVLSRYNRNRTIIAVFGAVVGGFGIGLTLDHSGTVTGGLAPITLAPSGLILALAIVSIWVDVPRSIRWSGVVVIVGGFMLLSGIDWHLTVPLGLVTAGIGAVAHRLLRFGVTAFVLSVQQAKEWLAIAVLVLVFAVDQRPASAQEPADCAAGEHRLEVTGPEGTFLVDSSDRSTRNVVLADETVRLSLEATTSFGDGSVIVEHIGSRPIPTYWAGRRVIWSADFFRNDPNRPTSTTGPVDLLVSRPTRFSTYAVESSSHDVRLPLMAGAGTYRVTFTDAATDESCLFDFELRVVADPLSTLVGRASLTAALAGLGFVGAASAAGPFRPAGWPYRTPSRPSLRDRGARTRSPSRVRPQVLEIVKDGVHLPPSEPVETPGRYDVMVRLSIVGEREHDVHEIRSHEDASLAALVDFRPKLVFAASKRFSISVPLTLDDPRQDSHISLAVGPLDGELSTIRVGVRNRRFYTELVDSLDTIVLAESPQMADATAVLDFRESDEVAQ